MAKGEVRFRITADSKPLVDATNQAEKELEKLQDKATEAAGSFGRIAEKAGPMGVAVAVAVGIAVEGFLKLAEGVAGTVEHLAEYSHEIEITAAKTGLSTDAIQKLGVAAKLTGTDMGAVTSAVGKMEKGIGSGNKAFEQMGLSLSKLKAASPDEAFQTVIARLNEMTNQSERAAAGAAVFGKGWQALAGIISNPDALNKAKELGAVVGGADVEAAAKLAEKSKELGIAWEAVQNQFAAAIASNPALLQGLSAMVEGLANVAKWIEANRGAIGVFTSAIFGFAQSAITGFKEWAEWIEKAGTKLQGLIDLVPGLRSAVTTLKDFGGYLGMANAAYKAPEVHAVSASIGGPATYDPAGQKAAAEATKEYLAAQKRAMAEYEASYKAMEREIASFVTQTHKLGVKESDEFWKQQQKLADDYGKWYLAELQARRATEAALAKAWEAEQQRQHDVMIQGLHDQQAFGDALKELGDAFGSSLLSGIGDAISGFSDFNAQAMQAETLTQKLTVAVNALASAYSAGVKSASPGKGALSGAAKGAGAGAAFGPWGMVIGGVIGGIAGFLGGKKGQSDELHGLQDQFAPLMAAAQKAGIVFQHTFDTKNATALKAAITEVQKALDTNQEAQQKLNDAIQRYGFTTEELGPVMAKQKLDEQAGQLYQDWQLLNAAGIDHTAIIEKMGPAVNDYVNTSVKAGQAIPEAMKPIIDDLFQHGKLLHENGEAYTQAEVDGLSYTKSMSEMFTDLIKKVGELVDSLNGIKPKTVPVNIEVHDPNNILDGGNGGGSGGGGRRGYDDGGIPNNADGGYYPARTGGTLVRVGEAGSGEWVVNRAQMAALTGGGNDAHSKEVLEHLRRMPQTLTRSFAAALVMAKA